LEENKEKMKSIQKILIAFNLMFGIHQCSLTAAGLPIGAGRVGVPAAGSPLRV